MTNQTGLKCWAFLIFSEYHSPDLSLWLGVWVHGLRIHGFMLAWSCLIIKVHAILKKILESSHYCTVINYFHYVMAHFNLMKQKFLNWTTLHIHLCGFQITLWMKQCTIDQHTNYLDTTNHSGYFWWFELLLSC